MNEEIVKFETAKLARENGFEEVTNANYWIKAKDKGDKSKYFLARDDYELEMETYVSDDLEDNVYHVVGVPTQSSLQKWLRDEHKIDIVIGFSEFSRTYNFDIFYIENGKTVRKSHRFEKHDTYEIALEKALNESLELI